jgi:diguanylate cyclase
MDTVARFGGEEFAIILPNCPFAFGQTVAERVRRCVSELAVEVAPNKPDAQRHGQPGRRLCAAVGALVGRCLWMERADRQLYRAKAEGRNRACLEQPGRSPWSAPKKRACCSASRNFRDT